LKDIVQCANMINPLNGDDGNDFHN